MRRIILTGKVSIYLNIYFASFYCVLATFVACSVNQHTHTHTSHTIRRQQVLQVTLNEPFKLSADSVKRFYW